MALRFLMRSGVYIVFIVGAFVSWLMKRYFDYDRQGKSKSNEALLSEITQGNPIEFLQNPNWRVRLQAVRALNDYSATEAIPALLPILNDDDPDVRDAAVNALIKYDNETVPHLLKILSTGQQNAREMALHALARIGGDEVFRGIADALLNDESAWIRIPAAKALGETGDVQYIDILTKALKDSHAEVYAAVAQALKQIGTSGAFQAINKNPYQSGDTEDSRNKMELG